MSAKVVENPMTKRVVTDVTVLSNVRHYISDDKDKQPGNLTKLILKSDN